MLENNYYVYLDAQIGVGTAENEPSKVAIEPAAIWGVEGDVVV